MRHSLTLKNIIEKQFQCNKLIIVPCHISLNLNEEVLISSAKALFIVGETFTGNNRLESLEPSAHFMRLCTTLLSEKRIQSQNILHYPLPFPAELASWICNGVDDVSCNLKDKPASTTSYQYKDYL